MLNMRWLSLFFLCICSLAFGQDDNNKVQSFDVVIVCHHKDYETLPRCVNSIKKFVPHHVRIFVIGNREIQNDSFIFVHESKFYMYVNPFLLQQAWKNHNKELAGRAFWIFQQFLKLGAHLIIPDLSQNYLCVDADVIWLSPQQFINNNDQFLYSKNRGCDCCKELVHHTYTKTNEKILKDATFTSAPFSFIGHHMMFNQTILKELLSHIEQVHQKHWSRAIISSINAHELSSFSEYELYGMWLWNKHQKRLIHRQLDWKDVNSLNYVPNEKLDFVVAHWYLRHIHNFGYPKKVVSGTIFKRYE